MQGLAKTLVISPAASGPERNWLPQRYAEIANHAHKQGFAVILTGAATELEQRLSAGHYAVCRFSHVKFSGQNLA